MPALRRIRYFDGRLLSAADLEREQQYQRDRHRRHVRWLHGTGVVDGLKVALEGGPAGTRVTVSPGFAVDPLGNELELETAVTLSVPESPPRLWVLIRHAEREVEILPGPAETGPEPAGPQAAWVEEFAEVVLVEAGAAVSRHDGDGVPLARLVRVRNAWRRDSRFRRPRIPGVVSRSPGSRKEP